MFKFNFSNDEQHDDDDKSDIINVQETTSIIESGLDGIQLEDGQPEKGRVLLEAKEIHSSSSSTTTTTTTTSEGDLYVIAETCILIPNSLILFKRMVSDVKFAIAQQDDDDDEGLDVERLDVPITTTTTTAITECHYDRNDTKALARTLLENTDLIGGVYEGGLKTWECSLDLVRHLHTHSIIPTITTTTSSSSSTLLTSHHLRVLELGCGSALPGIYCLTRGSGILVDFQDYNEEVLRLITIPNVLLNTTSVSCGLDVCYV